MTVPLVKQVHIKLAEYLQKGDVVVDATMGNGFDTLFLAQSVGEQGTVYAFDVQDKAINSTQARLDDAGVSERVSLIHDSHANLSNYLSSKKNDSIRCAVFNLGYLPGSDKTVKTYPSSTIKALNESINLLCNPGVISILAYTGHAGGRIEAEQVKAWAMSLPIPQYKVNIHIPRSSNINPPELILIETV